MLLVAPVRERHRAPARRRGPTDHGARTPTSGDGSTSSAPTCRRSPTSTTAPGSRPSTPAATPASTGCCEAFHRRTGCPVLVNTSFNVRGEPIVCTPEDAYRCFLATDMDVLVLEDVVLDQGPGPPTRPDARRTSRAPGPVPARLDAASARRAAPMQWSDIPFDPPAPDAPAVRRALAGLSSAGWRPGECSGHGLRRPGVVLAALAGVGLPGLVRPRAGPADLRRLDGPGLPDRLGRLAARCWRWSTTACSRRSAWPSACSAATPWSLRREPGRPSYWEPRPAPG